MDIFNAPKYLTDLDYIHDKKQRLPQLEAMAQKYENVIFGQLGVLICQHVIICPWIFIA